MNIQRQWVTPVTAGAFLLSAVTGVLIFFHVDSGANKFVHEWLSWVLLGGALLHTTANFNGLRAHLGTRRGQVVVGAFIAALMLSFIPLGGGKDEPPFAAPMQALSQTNLATLAQVAQLTPQELRERLGRAGFRAESDRQTVAELVGNDARKQMQVLGRVFRTAD